MNDQHYIRFHFILFIFLHLRLGAKSTSNDYNGFYISRKYGKNPSSRSICYASMIENLSTDQFYAMSEADQNATQFRLYYPNMGAQSRPTSFSDLRATALQITQEHAEQYWTKLHRFSKDQCQHLFWDGSCSLPDCDVSIIIF